MAEDVKISIKSTADNSGIEKAEKGLNNVKTAAQNASATTVSGASKMQSCFASLGSGIGKVTSAVGKLNAVFNAFGIIGMVTTLIGLFKSLKDWLDKDKVAAEELARVIQDKNNADAISRATENYKKLNEEIQKANRAQQFRSQLLAEEKAKKEGTEDAELDYEEAKELSQIAYDDPDAAQKQTIVRNKYAKTRAERAAQRAINNRISKQKELYDSADQKEEDAEKIMKGIEEDETPVSLRKQIQAEKDPERKKNLQSQLDKVIEANQQKMKEAEKLKTSAGEDREKAKAMFGSENAAIIKSKAELEALDKSSKDANSQMTANQKKRAEEKAKEEAKVEAEAKKKAQQQEEDRRTIENGEFEKQEIEGRIAQTQQEMQDAQDAHDRERFDVYQAQGNLDLFNAQNQGRKGGNVNKKRAELQETLNKETEEMRQSEAELNKTMSGLVSTLQSLKKQLAEINARVNQATSRQNVSADMSPAG